MSVLDSTLQCVKIEYKPNITRVKIEITIFMNAPTSWGKENKDF